MSERRINTREELKAALDRIEIANSFVSTLPKLGWEISAIECEGAWLVNMTYERPDTFSGVLGVGRGRKEFIYPGATESFVAKTAFILLDMLVHHELMEAFMYDGKRIFNPHHTVADLGLAADAWTARTTAQP